MKLFKKKEKLFGENIEKNCLYCRYNLGTDEVKCPNGSAPCKKYSYDPTLRTPKRRPKLNSYTEDDFSI